jgi:hypothetical protein
VRRELDAPVVDSIIVAKVALESAIADVDDIDAKLAANDGQKIGTAARPRRLRKADPECRR